MYKKWIKTLLKVNLFKDIEESELESILCCLGPSILHYKKKEYITMEEDFFTGIGIIVEGEVVVAKENVAGDRVIMAKLNESDIFGEIIAFSGKKRWPSTVIAQTDCTILFFPPEKILGNCPKMCIGHKVLIENMVKIVSIKAIGLNKKIEYLMIKSIRAKVSTYLLEQYSLIGKTKFTIGLKRNELAEFLNVSRPSLSREMIKMRDERIIDFNRSSIEILNLEKLKKSI